MKFNYLKNAVVTHTSKRQMEKNNELTEKRYNNKQNINRYSRFTNLSALAPSVPTFKQACALIEPRPNIELEHLAPRNVLPSLLVIENASCDLTDLYFMIIITFLKRNT